MEGEPGGVEDGDNTMGAMEGGDLDGDDEDDDEEERSSGSLGGSGGGGMMMMGGGGGGMRPPDGFGHHLSDSRAGSMDGGGDLAAGGKGGGRRPGGGGSSSSRARNLEKVPAGVARALEDKLAAMPPWDVRITREKLLQLGGLIMVDSSPVSAVTGGAGRSTLVSSSSSAGPIDC